MTAVLDGFQLTQVDNRPKSKQHNLVFWGEVSDDFDRFSYNVGLIVLSLTPTKLDWLNRTLEQDYRISFRFSNRPPGWLCVAELNQ